MTDLAPTILPLDGRLGWLTHEGLSVAAGPDGLRLTADPQGPLGLGWRDGSLGGLVMPRGFAVDDDGGILLLAPRSPWAIRRFDSDQGTFVDLPTIGGAGRDARLFRRPRNIALAGRSLYVADTGNHRVQVFDLPTLALRYVWTIESVAGHVGRLWHPVDVTTHDGSAFVLDGVDRRVYRQQPSGDRLESVVEGPADGGRWRRVAIDRDGQIYVLESGPGQAPRLLAYDAAGAFLRVVHDAGEVRGAFPVPPVQMLFERGDRGQGHFRLRLADHQQCARHETERAQASSATCTCEPLADGSAGTTLTFDRDGRPVAIDQSQQVEQPRYAIEGVWSTKALNSRTFRCQWHRIELDMDPLPPGTQVTVHTSTSDEPVQDPRFEVTPSFTAMGRLQPPPIDGSVPMGRAGTGPGQPHDFLIQSWPGQYLYLKVTMKSDGFDTPVVRGLRVHFPRDSYVSYLPAIYSGEDINRSFLERFLGIFQTDWDDLERRIRDLPKYFDSDAVPAADGFLDALAERFGLPLEGAWSGEQRRTLLRGMRDFYTHRGTAIGLRAYLQAYLENMSGLDREDQGAFPILVEGFRERPHLELTAPGVDHQGTLLPLWSPEAVGRLKLGSFARVGAARLMDAGDPNRDIFEQFAHRFRVYVPATWVRTADDERMLHRALEAEKPAHAAYELELVEPRFLVGIQSTVGMDTVLGDYPLAELTCLQREHELPEAGRGKRHRLGYDTVLSGCRGDAGFLIVPTALASTAGAVTPMNQIQLH